MLLFCIFVFIVIVCVPKLFFNKQPITPKNIFLITYFIKLVIVPITVIWFGFVDNPIYKKSDDIGYGVYINTVSFLCLCLGYLFYSYLPVTKIENSLIQFEKKIYLSRHYIVVIFFAVVIFSISYRFSNLSLIELITIPDATNDNNEAKPVLGFISNIGRFAFPFLSVMLLTDKNLQNRNLLIKTSSWMFVLLSAIICTLGSNRTNLIYMVLCVAALFSIKVKRIPFYIIIVAAIFIAPYLTNYTQARASTDIETFTQTLQEVNNESVISTLQVYFQAPQTVLNLNTRDASKDHFTLFNSFFESFPFLGKDLRQKSGTYYYNMYIYHSDIAKDQVYPFGAEIDKNLGLAGLVCTYFFIGIIFCVLQSYFFTSIALKQSSIVLFCIIYASIYLNAVNVLSISVLGQFIFYNSFPLLLIFLLSKMYSFSE